jgi:hypothetical protein
MSKKHARKAQSSLELLITLAFGLAVLLPIVVLAFLQVAGATSTLATAESQEVATKLAGIATAVGSQGYPAKQLVLVQVPPNINNIYVGNVVSSNSIGHEIVLIVSTNAGPSYVTAYTPVNVSGYLQNILQPGTYLVNVSAQNSCPSLASVPCVYIRST